MTDDELKAAGFIGRTMTPHEVTERDRAASVDRGLSEPELTTILGDVAQACADGERFEPFGQHCEALVAEIRRLQALVRGAEWAGDDDNALCPWCGGLTGEGADGSGHAVDCPAFSAPGVLR